MKIGIDIDDTITNSWEHYIPIYSQLFNVSIDELKKSTPYYESIKGKCTLEEYYNYMLPIYDAVTPNITLKENVKETIDKLYELGHQVIFITSRGKDHTDPYQASKNYLDKHNIKYDKIIVDSKDKGKVCQEEQIDLFIDDSIKHCKSVSSKGIDVILFGTNYNKQIKEFKRIETWDEIYEYIKSR